MSPSFTRKSILSPDLYVATDDDLSPSCHLYFTTCCLLIKDRCFHFFSLPFVPYSNPYVSSSFIIKSGHLDLSIVCHGCFELFQHTMKIDGDLVYVFDLLVSIDNNGE